MQGGGGAWRGKGAGGRGKGGASAENWALRC